jgi:signal transduction histidine kinase
MSAKALAALNSIDTKGITNHTKSNFHADMGHELRTSLHSVIGFSEVLLDELSGPMNELQKEYAENILYNGKHLLSLINTMRAPL